MHKWIDDDGDLFWWKRQNDLKVIPYTKDTIYN